MNAPESYSRALEKGTLITTLAGMAVQRLHLGRVRHQHVPDELSGHQEAV